MRAGFRVEFCNGFVEALEFFRAGKGETSSTRKCHDRFSGHRFTRNKASRRVGLSCGECAGRCGSLFGAQFLKNPITQRSNSIQSNALCRKRVFRADRVFTAVHKRLRR